MADNLVKYLAWKRKRAMYADQSREDNRLVCAVTMLVDGTRMDLGGDGEPARALIAALEEISKRSPFELLAYSLLPDHLNLLLAARSAGASLRLFLTEMRLRCFKAYRKAGGKGKLWQEHYFDHTLAHSEDLTLAARKMVSVPVEKGLVSKPEDWAYAWMAPKMPW